MKDIVLQFGVKEPDLTKIATSTLAEAYKPYDIVTDKKGNVGFIHTVNVNPDQDIPKWQISYAITWLVAEDNLKTAWFKHDELIKYGNIFIKIAENSCSTKNVQWVSKLMKGLDVSEQVETIFPIIKTETENI